MDQRAQPTSSAAADAARTLERLRGALVVSVQAEPSSPLRDTPHIVAMALAALAGGAQGLRLRGETDIRALRPLTSLPIIGLTKQDHPDTEVYITATPEEVRQVAAAGADLVALDATLRPRPHPVAGLVAAAHAAGALALADISTLEEARAALTAGADLVSTTMSGYTAHSPRQEAPDWALMRHLAGEGMPFIAEGRLRSPQDAAQALALGALCVVVGSAITRPDDLTRWFLRAMR